MHFIEIYITIVMQNLYMQLLYLSNFDILKEYYYKSINKKTATNRKGMIKSIKQIFNQGLSPYTSNLGVGQH